MRRKITIATGVAMLVAASAAYAALNTYGAGFSFSPSKAGSAKHPSPIGFVQTLSAANAVPADRAAPLIDINTKIYGLAAEGKYFPSCSHATIVTGPKFDAACPKGSQVATGQVKSLLGGTTLSQSGTACNPQLHVYNAGNNRLWFFFTTRSAADCGGLTTGATAPYEGFVKRAGKYLDTDVPLPPDISIAVAGHNGLYGSLIKESLTWKRLTTRVKGKTVGFQESVGCKSGKRPWSVAFTATNSSGARETRTVTGSARC